MKITLEREIELHVYMMPTICGN